MNRKQRRATAKAGHGAPSAEARADDKRQLWSEATDALAQGAWREAEDLLVRLIGQGAGGGDVLAALAEAQCRQGKADEAIANYRGALALRPKSAEWMNNLGVVLAGSGRVAEAIGVFRRALAAQPDNADALRNLAVALCDVGQIEDAVAAFDRLAGMNPRDPAALHGLGTTLRLAGRLQDAAFVFRHLVTLAPDVPDALEGLAGIEAELGRHDDAAAAYGRLVRLRPGDADALCRLGIALAKGGAFEAAVAALRQALELRPGHAEAVVNIGAALCGLGELDEAQEWCRRAIEMVPSSAEAHANLGNVFRAQDRFEEAAAIYRQVIQLDPGLAEAHSDLGLCMVRLERAEDAVPILRHALSLKPDLIMAHCALGGAFCGLGRIDEAAECYRHALALDPHMAEAHSDLGHMLLLSGRYLEGWHEYEARFDGGGVGQRPFPQRRWRGDKVTGRRLLVWGEQGIGDELTVFAVLPELVKRGARVVVECDPRLVPLLARSLPEIEAVARRDPPEARLLADDIELQVPLVSAAALLRPSPAGFRPLRPYLTAEPAAVGDLRRKYGDGPLVGISWWTRHPKLERTYSLPLAEWRPILAVPGIRFVSLQYGGRDDEIAQMRASGIDLATDDSVDPLTDLDRFAAQVAAMDLVISVDNSTVSMASALGRPAWDLLAFVPDWRMGLAGESSPWYPGIRLFRQPAPGAWGPVVAEVAAALGAWVAAA